MVRSSFCCVVDAATFRDFVERPGCLCCVCFLHSPLHRLVSAAMKCIMRGEKGNEKREICGHIIEIFEY